MLQLQPGSPPAARPQDDSESFHCLQSGDPLIKDTVKIIRNIAKTEATVLIRGESSTGKKLVASEALQRAGGHLETAASHADMSLATFWRKRKKYGV